MGNGGARRLLPQRRGLPRRMAGAGRRTAARRRTSTLTLAHPASRARRTRPRARGARRRRVNDASTAIDLACAPDRALIRVSLERRRAVPVAAAAGRAARWCRAAWAQAARIASARIWPAQEYTRVIVESTAPLAHQLRRAARIRIALVLDLDGVDSSPELAQLPTRVQPTDPYIAAIRFGTQAAGRAAHRARPEGRGRSPTALRADAGRRVRPSPRARPLSARSPLDPLMALLESEKRAGRAQRRAGRRAGAPRCAEPQPPARSAGRAARSPIAIDPGHGGEDPGAIGRRGTYEKNVALAIAQQAEGAASTPSPACARC